MMRRRLFSESQLEKDYFLSTIEQHKVDDITINAFYQSRTLTVLAVIWISLALIACSRSALNSLEENLCHGFIAVFVIFIFVSVMIMPNGPFIRPHPAIWRMVFGASLFYFLCLVVTVFLRLDEARQIIIWFYPELKSMRHSDILDKEYAVNCSEVTLARIYSHMDIFALAHFFGWVVKTVLLRHRMIAWTLSINWEITEMAFSHILPNFNECWWDSLLLDILLCNGLGIEVGMFLCRWLEMRNFQWDSIRDIRGASGKLKRAVLQFTPSSWTHTRWLQRDSSFLRSVLLSQLIIVWQLAELNAFFLKHVFIVKPSHPLTQMRLLLITLMSAPAIRQYYLYVIDPHVKRVGSQLWLFIATVLTETLVCFKLGSETFEKAILWNLVYWVFWMVLSSFLTVWLCRYLADSLNIDHQAFFNSQRFGSTTKPPESTLQVPSKHFLLHRWTDCSKDW
ncbi:Phosphatidyl serine synthase [Fasciola hepatica]|uniref:Phosphatidylserine synthase n=1 Tax=Fasciola hepatica TaxID=6192 RepID=A0A4E0R5G7_FASHE|nr:Phosphatidyl serine synthase [Fasciola hepatica]